jgi:hypothetical protein
MNRYHESQGFAEEHQTYDKYNPPRGFSLFPCIIRATP